MHIPTGVPPTSARQQVTRHMHPPHTPATCTSLRTTLQRGYGSRRRSSGSKRRSSMLARICICRNRPVRNVQRPRPPELARECSHPSDHYRTSRLPYRDAVDLEVTFGSNPKYTASTDGMLTRYSSGMAARLSRAWLHRNVDCGNHQVDIPMTRWMGPDG